MIRPKLFPDIGSPGLVTSMLRHFTGLVACPALAAARFAFPVIRGISFPTARNAVMACFSTPGEFNLAKGVRLFILRCEKSNTKWPFLEVQSGPTCGGYGLKEGIEAELPLHAALCGAGEGTDSASSDEP